MDPRLKLSAAAALAVSGLIFAMLSIPVPAAAQARLPVDIGSDFIRLLSQLPATSTSRTLATPLPPSVLNLLANEISGQMAFNNEVLLAGAPVLRDEKELNGTFFETQKMYDLARAAGLEDVEVLRYPVEGTFSYAREGELWLTRPETKLIARLGADAALVVGDSLSTDLNADLVYLPPPSDEQVKSWLASGPQEKLRGKVALMWSHPRRDVAQALDAAGVAGVISYYAEDRYFDPDQAVYTGGSYGRMKSLRFGLTISWRQWSELLEDIEQGRGLAVRCHIVSATYPERIEGIRVRIPGTEPDKKGVIFTAHLFEGYTKKGANDDMSGCVAELEIARGLNRLITQGRLPAPRRSITFLWTNEIMGTFEYLRRHPGLGRTLSADINMDMVGEGLRKNNAQFILTETPSALPSYTDGLGRSILNYIWRTNDIVYLPDSPPSPSGEQVFPKPIWEKNGSRDAFRFDVEVFTGGSDHICFANPSVGVPAVSLNIWPDQWYHADTDTPDKSDPTQLRRVAFAGAAMAWAAVSCDDGVMPGMVDAVSEFAYDRVSRRELPAALRAIQESGPANLAANGRRASHLLDLAVEREAGAIGSLNEIGTGSGRSRALVSAGAELWRTYGEELQGLIQKATALRAAALRLPLPAKPALIPLERRYDAVRPALSESVRGMEFRVEMNAKYRDYLKAHPDALKDIGLDPAQRHALMDYVDGRRSLTTIRDRAESETSTDIPLDKAVKYFELLKSVDYIKY